MASSVGITSSQDRLITNYCKALQSDASAKDALRARMFALLAHTDGMTQLKIQPILLNDKTALPTRLYELHTIEQRQPGAFKYAPDLSFLVRANRIVVRGTPEERQALLRSFGDTEAARNMQSLFAHFSRQTPAPKALVAPAKAPAKALAEPVEKKEEKREEKKGWEDTLRRTQAALDAPLPEDRAILEQADLDGSSRPLPPPVLRTDASAPSTPGSSDSYAWQLWSSLPGLADIGNWFSGTKPK